MIWPLSALTAWALAWALFLGLHTLHAPLWLALTTASLTGAALSPLGNSTWRRLFIAAGFPLSLAISGLGAHFPAWIWLIPLGILTLLYPMNSWKDAPLFPTPAGILEGLPDIAPLTNQARILDAGCGLGAGLIELRRIYPKVHLTGLEWSWPLRILSGLRCGFASVKRGDIWKEDWSRYDMIYMFQRPESMLPATRKAQAELRPGSWLVSLEFEATELTPRAILRNREDKPVWVYCMQADDRHQQWTST